MCDLHYFVPFKMTLDLNSATGLMTVSSIKEKKNAVLALRPEIRIRNRPYRAEMDPQKANSITASELPILTRYKELFVHLSVGYRRLIIYTPNSDQRSEGYLHRSRGLQ